MAKRGHRRRKDRPRSRPRGRPTAAAEPAIDQLPPGFEPGHIQVFDSGKSTSDGKHGVLGPAHCARFPIPDHEYQIEIYLDEAAEMYPDARRALAPDGRRWTREPGGAWRRA